MDLFHRNGSREMAARSMSASPQISPNKLALGLVIGMAFGLTSVPRPAAASEGCTVLLCLAGNWRNISACVPPVRTALRDLALGRSFPFCALASPSFSIDATAQISNVSADDAQANSQAAPETQRPQNATLRWTSADFCPAQYLSSYELESGTAYTCDFTGAIEVTIGGQLWNRTWWNMAGDSVTEWSAAARTGLPASSIDDRFDRDFQAWQQRQREAPATPPGPEQGAGA